MCVDRKGGEQKQYLDKLILDSKQLIIKSVLDTLKEKSIISQLFLKIKLLPNVDLMRMYERRDMNHTT